MKRECIHVEIDGRPVHVDGVRHLTVATVTKSLPGYKTVEAEVPYQDGVITQKLARFEQGVFTLGVKVKGLSAREHRENFHNLMRLLYAPTGRQVRITVTDSLGVPRSNWGRVREQSVHEINSMTSDVRVEFDLANPVWESDPRWVPVPHTGSRIELNSLPAGTGPVMYAVTLAGEGTGITVTDAVSGETTQWAGERDTAKVLTIAGWSATESVSQPSTIPARSNAALSAEIESVGRLWPDLDGKYVVRVDVPGAGRTTAVQLYVGAGWL